MVVADLADLGILVGLFYPVNLVHLVDFITLANTVVLVYLVDLVDLADLGTLAVFADLSLTSSPKQRRALQLCVIVFVCRYI